MTAGHGRTLVAEFLHEQHPFENWDMVPVERQDYDDDAMEYADVQADNAIALWAELDIDEIKLDIKEFPDLKLEHLGIEKLSMVTGHARSDDDSVPSEVEMRVESGDIWQLGRHRLMCGDSSNPDQMAGLLDGEFADMVFTSPPYNVGMKYNGYDDKKTISSYMSLMSSIATNCFESMKDGRLIGWNIGVSPKSGPHRHAAMLEECGFRLFRHIVWKKTGAQIPLWQNSTKKPWARNYFPNYNHEMVYMMLKGKTVELGAPTEMPDQLSMDVWDVSQFAAGGNNHPAAFPVHLAEMAIKVMSAPDELALEPFCGSGTTIIACEKTSRICRAMELDPHYCDVSIARWEKYTGQKSTKV